MSFVVSFLFFRGGGRALKFNLDTKTKKGAPGGTAIKTFHIFHSDITIRNKINDFLLLILYTGILGSGQPTGTQLF